MIVKYWKWLENERLAVCKRFLTRVDSSSLSTVEGAVGEAAAWNWLSPRCDTIRLNEREDSGGVDFQCEGAGESYFVEVTTITTPTASDQTGLDHLSVSKGSKFYGTATEAIKKEIISKSSQVAGLNSPVLLFVSTLHW